MVKKILNCMMWFFIILLAGTLVITLVNYFNVMDNKIVSAMKFILPMISMIISSYRLGKGCDKLGYLEGLKFGSIVSLIFILLVIILDKLSLKSILYYGILILTSVMGIIILIFMLLVILLDKLEVKSIIYYGILLLTSVMGSMIGINRKKLNA